MRASTTPWQTTGAALAPSGRESRRMLTPLKLQVEQIAKKLAGLTGPVAA
jgi:hypothetical protein